MIFNLMKPVPVKEETATMYSYNGTVLPALPEWDKEKYPYCAIGMFGTLYCYSVTDGTDYLTAPFLKFEFLNELTGNGKRKGFYWDECKIIETDYNIMYVIWANHDLDSLKGSEPVPMYLPITLFDGERTFSIESWQDPSDTIPAYIVVGSEFGFCEGDTLEITLDGHTEIYTARTVDQYNNTFVGNYGLVKNDIEGADDGGDILLTAPYFTTTGWTIIIYTRTPGTHQITIKLIGVK